MNEPIYGNGKICYIDIPSADINISSTFYKNVFGWNIRTRGDGSIAFDDGVGQVSGTWSLKREPSRNPGLLIYIMVDSVEDTIQKITDNGGKITQQIGADAPEITARFSDPAGNILGLYQNP
jgi:predicted enzyme related to lactoylglutathione lyase